MTTIDLAAVSSVDGEVRPGGDKSISHRALILGALAKGRTYLSDLSPAADVANTASCLEACGASLHVAADRRAVVEGKGPGESLHTPAGPLDCGNSGSTMRMLAGVVAGHNMFARLDGDASLRRRPMRRVADPLRRMGAAVQTSPAGTAPLTVEGRRTLTAITLESEIASAQVKTAVLLAALSADGPTTVVEPICSRDHSERLLRLCGVAVAQDVNRITVVPGALEPFGLRIPQDISSAAFFLCLAAARPGWRVRCPGLGLNWLRTGVLDVLRAMGAQVDVEETEPAGGIEMVGGVEVRGAQLRAVTIEGALVPRLIDELPVIAVLATQAEGSTVIRDAGELRVKESDRIASIGSGLRAMGATCEMTADGMVIEGPVQLRPASVHADGDHRLAMAFAVAACLTVGAGTTRVDGAETVATSYPRFLEDLARLVR